MYDTSFRPIISVIRLTPDNSLVEVTLEMDERLSTGVGDITDEDVVAAAGQATCVAVGKLLPQGHQVTLQWARRFAPDEEGGQAVINCAVHYSSPARPDGETLLGAALIHHDQSVAAVRATLNGLTRRLGPLLLP